MRVSSFKVVIAIMKQYHFLRLPFSSSFSAKLIATIAIIIAVIVVAIVILAVFFEFIALKSSVVP